MIRKIKSSNEDIKNIPVVYNRDPSLDNVDFFGVVVNKPWGYEYLMFQNKDIAIWLLYIKRGFSTSTHCHLNKKTSLLVLSGEAIGSTLNEKFNLKEKEGLIYDNKVFHKTEAISENGVFLIEVETPNDKTDLFRLKDNYNRESESYTKKKNITNKTYNYNYQYINGKNNEKIIFGKYKIFLKEFYDRGDMINTIDKIKPDVAIIINGKIKLNNEDYTTGDAISVSDLRNSELDNAVKLILIHERENLIQLSDYIIDFLVKKDILNAFLVSEGKIMHLLDSVRRNEKMNYLCNHNEQASAIAAEAYAKATGKPGFLLIGGGSAGTNALTGVANAWVDSIPLIIISGQSNEEQTVKDSGLRQLGVKELNIIDIVRPVTKYAVVVKDKNKIRYHLEKAYHLATSGRPGPVWLDIPINLQNEKISEDELEIFNKPIIEEDINLKESIQKILQHIKEAERPVILVGSGVRISGAEKEFLKLVEILDIPVLVSRNARDILWEKHPLYVGNPGAFGQRVANFVVSNSDLLLSIGSRISFSTTGWAYNDFAREAKKIIVDIDENELRKVNIKPDIAIKSDAKRFILEALNNLNNYNKKDLSIWKEKISYWKKKYPIVLEEYRKDNNNVNPYYFIEVLSDLLNENDFIVTDTGMSYHCTLHGFKSKKGQRIINPGGLDIGGYGVPASIGACIAKDKKRIVCICGDGGLMGNIQELSVIKKHNFPIKIFIINNKGITTMRMAQKYYFEDFTGSDDKSGFALANIKKISGSYGLAFKRIENNKNLSEEIKEVLDFNGPVLCELNVSENEEIKPKQGAFIRPDGKTVPRPIEDMTPFINRDEFEKEMIIDVIPFDPYKE